MARLQILQLPEGASDDRPPFALVINQTPAEAPGFEALRRNLSDSNLAEKIGARAVLVFEDTIDIPANEIPVGPDGYPLRVRIEPDFEGFREQVQDEASAACGALTGARYIAEQYSGPSAAEQRIELARQALAADGYFSPDEIGDDIAPRITEWLTHHREQAEEFRAAIRDALGLDNDDSIDLIHAARSMRDVADRRRAIEAAIHAAHRPVRHRGATICMDCSGHDGKEHGSTDNAPVPYPCDSIKALDAKPDEGEPEEGNG